MKAHIAIWKKTKRRVTTAREAMVPRTRQALHVVLALLFLLLMTMPAFSQSCALCYTQAASSGQRMIQALRDGILILVIPPTLGSVGMLFIIHRKRNQVRSAENKESSQLDW
jgi:hypothetical protein